MSRAQDASSDGGADTLATAVLTASRALVGVSARSLADVEDRLTLTQFRTLVVLRTHKRSPLRALAKELGVTSSSAVRTVDVLVETGLVSRSGNPQDRREALLDLTDEGRRIVDLVTSRRRDEIREIVDRMPDAHQAWLVAALHTFAEAAGEPPADLAGW